MQIIIIIIIIVVVVVNDPVIPVFPHPTPPSTIFTALVR